MKIIDSEKLEKFIRKHADADKAIQKWIEICEAANLEKSFRVEK